MGKNDGGGLTVFNCNDNENTYQLRLAFIERGGNEWRRQSMGGMIEVVQQPEVESAGLC